MSILYTTDDGFDIDTGGVLPTLVVFTAPWCGPCRTLAPTLEEIEKTYAGCLTIIKIDIDKCPKTPSRFNVKGIPTCILLKDGAEVGRVLGSVKGNLVALLDDNL